MKILALLLGLSLWLTANIFAQENKSIFWTSPQGVFQASLSDRQPTALASVTLLGPNQIAIDTLGQKLYWVDAFVDKISRSNLDGTESEDLVTTGQLAPLGLSLDVNGGKMYWADVELGAVKRANLDGTEEEVLFEDINRIEPLDTALDLIARKLYWLAEDFRGEIVVQRADLDGSNIEDILIHGNIPIPISSPQYIELDVANNKLYIAGRFDLYRANLDGTEPELIVGSSDRPQGFALDPLNNKIYWIALNDGQETLRRANTDGSEVEDVFKFEQGAPFGLALEPSTQTIFWADPGEQAIFKSKVDGTDEQKIITTEHILPRGISWHPESNQLFWGDWSHRRVLAVDMATTMMDTILTTATGLGFGSRSRVNGMSVDYTDGKIYWASPDGGTIRYRIQRSDLDGSNVEDVLTEDDGLESHGIDLKLDLSERYMYWTQQFSGGVQKAPMDGGPIEGLDRDDEAHVIGIAIDSTGKKIYWTQSRFVDSNTRYSIVRANLDGSDREALITEDIRAPFGIALDLENQKMYWADFTLNMIRRANLDGTDVEDVISTHQPRWVAVGDAPSLTNITHTTPKSTFALSSFPNPFTTSITLEYTLGRTERTHHLPSTTSLAENCPYCWMFSK